MKHYASQYIQNERVGFVFCFLFVLVSSWKLSWMPWKKCNKASKLFKKATELDKCEKLSNRDKQKN